MSTRSNITAETHNRWGSLSSKLWAATTLVALLFPLTAITNPAHAASQTVAIDCNPSGMASTPVALQVGDSLTINSSNCVSVELRPGSVGVATYGPSGTESTVNPGAANNLVSGDTVIYTATVVGAASLDVFAGFIRKGVTYSITVSAGSTPAPAPVTQEFGRPASGTCDAAQPAGLNWADVPSGGWAHSWSQWMNGGAGGFVCTRTLVYSNKLGAWTVS